MLMPRTWTFNPANVSRSASYDGIWSVQTGVQAIGKNASTTVLPRKSERVTSFPRWQGRVKSGAFRPIFGFILISVFGWIIIFPISKDYKSI